MKIFITAALTCCLIVVIALQAIILRSQNHWEPVAHLQPANNAPLPHIETVSYAVEEGGATDAGTEEPSWKTEQPTLNPPDEDTVQEPAPIPDNPFFDAAAVNEPLPSLVPADSEPAVNVIETGPAPATLSLGPARNEPVEPLQFNPSAGPQSSVQPSSQDAPTAEEAEQPKPDPELVKYPIWLLIKPDGVRFLQTEEEIATNFHTIPPNAFLIGCRSATFKAGVFDEFAPAGAESETEGNDSQRAFNLSCDVFTLKGRYGTKQQIEVTGSTLSFSTSSQLIRLHADKPQPLEFHSWDESAENRMQADEITLQLREDGFQMSAKGASGLEITPNPDPNKQLKRKPKPGGFDQSPRDTFSNEVSPFG